jgi:DNA-directed RNA polymerase subunit RPC12/RpoP
MVKEGKMPRASEIVKCVDCGKEFPRKGLNRKFRCPDCAMKKMTDVVRQVYAKSGPEYEHWKAQIKASIGRL